MRVIIVCMTADELAKLDREHQERASAHPEGPDGYRKRKHENIYIDPETHDQAWNLVLPSVQEPDPEFERPSMGAEGAPMTHDIRELALKLDKAVVKFFGGGWPPPSADLEALLQARDVFCRYVAMYDRMLTSYLSSNCGAAINQHVMFVAEGGALPEVLFQRTAKSP